MSEANSIQVTTRQDTEIAVETSLEESKPKPVTFEDIMTQLDNMVRQIKQADASESEINNLASRVANLEAAISWKASEQTLKNKKTGLPKKPIMQADEEVVDRDEIDAMVEKQLFNGMGPAALDQSQCESIRQEDMFKDVSKARKQFIGFK